MKKIWVILLLISSSYFTQAQFAFIPDTSFRNFLMNNGFAGCMQGDSLDTTCTAVVNATLINCDNKGIYDLTGIQYFDNLNDLLCRHNQLTTIPELEHVMNSISCEFNQITNLPNLPSSLVILTCNNNLLTTLPPLPANLNTLECFSNQLTTLPALPPILNVLYCQYNSLTSLPTLPAGLYRLDCFGNQLSSLPVPLSSMGYLDCRNNQLTSLPLLPSSIYHLDCGHNIITSLPSLPNTMSFLDCQWNQLNALPALPDSLQILRCSDNPLGTLPPLPNRLINIDCSNSQLTNIPPLPASLLSFYCNQNQLSTLPALPPSLSLLACESSQLTSLPNFPPGLRKLYCDHNQLSVLPDLPDTLIDLYINDNPIVCLPEVNRVTNFYWANTGIFCLPHYINVSTAVPGINNLSLCQPSSNCPAAWNINGTVFFDADSNCVQDTNEISLKDMPVVLDSGGVQLQEFLTDIAGRYSFRTGAGNYTLRIDTSNAPFRVVCPATFFETSLLNAVDSMDTVPSFGLLCNYGFDLTAKSISPMQIFRPGFQNTIYLNAGEGMSFSGVNCSSVNGTVQAILNSLTAYISPAPGAVTPTTINGDTVTWNISDFSSVDPVHDFNIIAEISTSATIYDSICVQLNVLPAAGDNIPVNNSLSECFPVRASYDPNEKYMSPSGLVDTSQQWFTFTVYFQNVGNAPAENIFILDSLDQNLDATTFTYLSSSHNVITQMLPGNLLRFNYPGINLADSTTDEPGSHGYVQYKVRRKDNLPVNTTISNTAYIYFDFNAPVVTNTVDATFTLNVSMQEKEVPTFYLYPNPVGSMLTIKSGQLPIQSIEIINLFGIKLIEKPFAAGIKSFNIDVEDLPQGVYFLKLQTEKYSETRKFVKQE